MYFCKYAYNLLWRTQFTWVVDACFIASQIDVWTQAYNGSTSRRKYVLNLLNVLHKNVTEEYKTDQFLHVIYWFLIYKSNLGNFFRNEWIFFYWTSSFTGLCQSNPQGFPPVYGWVLKFFILILIYGENTVCICGIWFHSFLCVLVLIS